MSNVSWLLKDRVIFFKSTDYMTADDFADADWEIIKLLQQSPFRSIYLVIDGVTSNQSVKTFKNLKCNLHPKRSLTVIYGMDGGVQVESPKRSLLGGTFHFVHSLNEGLQLLSNYDSSLPDLRDITATAQN